MWSMVSKILSLCSIGVSIIWALASSYPLIASISSATKSFNIVWTSSLAASGSTGNSSSFLASLSLTSTFLPANGSSRAGFSPLQSTGFSSSLCVTTLATLQSTTALSVPCKTWSDSTAGCSSLMCSSKASVNKSFLSSFNASVGFLPWTNFEISIPVFFSALRIFLYSLLAFTAAAFLGSFGCSDSTDFSSSPGPYL